MFLGFQTLIGNSNKEAEMVVWAHFLNPGKVNFKGQYEAKLSWIKGHPLVPRNFNLARKENAFPETRGKQVGS